MSQFADGGKLATKPYVSSASYIDKMSDYCQGCKYDKKQRIGENACPFNSLYWQFFMQHKQKLASNPRLGIVYAQLAKMDDSTQQQIHQQASHYLSKLEEL
jgi:deoxyribodipyrimidine photolyase-related protein